MKSVALVSLIAGMIFFTALGKARLWDRDEPRNAQCAAEMFARGDWVVPTFAGELRGHKPAMLYWMQIAAYHVLGVNEFAARLPSVLCGLGTVLCTMCIATRLLGQRAGQWAGISLATSAMFVVASRAATPDGPLIFFSTLAVTLYVLGAYRRNEKLQFQWPHRIYWAGIYTTCGLAMLSKGPVGVLLPLAVIGLHGMLQSMHLRGESANETQGAVSPLRRAVKRIFESIRVAWTAACAMHPVMAIIVIGCVVGPWYVAVHVQTEGEFTREFFWHHNVHRAMTPMEGHSGPPLLFYMAALLVGTFPWSLFWVPVVLVAKDAWKDPDLRPAVSLSLVWICIYVLCFSVAQTKLPSYITPCYPGVALSVAIFCCQLFHQTIYYPRLVVTGLGFGLVIGVAMAIALAGPIASYIPGAQDISIAGVLLAVSSVLAIHMLMRGNGRQCIGAFTVGAVLSIWLLFAAGPRAADDCRGEISMIREHFKKHSREAAVVLGAVEPSWVFYARGSLNHWPIDTQKHWLSSTENHLKRSASNTAILPTDHVLELTGHLDGKYGSIEIVSHARGIMPKDDWTIVRLVPVIAHENQSSQRSLHR